MTTRVTTNELQVFKRTWLDLDPKVRNAGEVWLLTVFLCIAGLIAKVMTWLDAGYLFVPVTLALFTAYVTTSKHKDLDLTALVKEAGVVADTLSPLASRAMPAAAPVIEAASKMVHVVEDSIDNPEATAEKAQQSFTAVVSDIENKTQVLPPRGASFLEALSSQKPPAMSTATAGISAITSDNH